MHTYFLSRQGDGDFCLVDVTADPVHTVQLSLNVVGTFMAYMGHDGRLRIVEPVGSALHLDWKAVPLQWYQVDPVTGETLASEQKHFWCWTSALAPLFHEPSWRVFGMVDANTIAIMDATSLQEIARCRPLQQPQQPMPHGTSMYHKAAWSHSGAMLAVASVPKSSVYGRRHGAESNVQAMVHVYDTSSGCCLQSQRLLCYSVGDFSWSARHDVLALQALRYWYERSGATSPSGILLSPEGTFVQTHPPSGAPAFADGLEPGAAEGSHPWQGPVVLMDPAAQKVQQVHCIPNDAKAKGAAEWHQFSWSPCGQLLLAGWARGTEEGNLHDRGHDGFNVIDPRTLAVVHSDDRPALSVSWAVGKGCDFTSGQPYISACFSGPQESFIFSQARDGMWTATCFWSEEYDIAFFQISPDSRTLVGSYDSEEGEEPERPFVHHYSHATPPDRFLDAIVPDAELPFENMALTTEFSPLPCAWPSIYAYVHPPVSTSKLEAAQVFPAQKMIRLVCCKTHTVLGSWTESVLSELASGKSTAVEEQVDVQMRILRWAPDAQHLAVICAEHIYIMTFGQGA